MACYHPIPAYQAGPGAKLVLNPPIGYEHLQVPCGNCLGCRAARATQWAHRCEHEASLYDHNCFITLTYSDKNLPPWGWVRDDHLALFLKRLRQFVASDRSREFCSSDRSRGVRFFACGEYGETTGRPHYHAILFNCRFDDLRLCRKQLYESASLGKLWQYGEHTIGHFSGGAANYIAKYALKDNGKRACDADGVWHPKPFLRMSLRPGIGAEWLNKYGPDLRHGYLVHDGKKCAVPLAYKRRLKKLGVPLSDEVEYAASVSAKAARGDKADPARLADAEVIHASRSLVARSL